MYKLFTANKRTEKILEKYISLKQNVKKKLDLLKTNPRKYNRAHPLHGRLKGKWACWLSSNIRAIYSINNKEQIIIIEAIGTHKVY